VSEIQNLRARESKSMVGTRHAVSDNKSTSGLGMPSPYIPERKQILIPIYRPFITYLPAIYWPQFGFYAMDSARFCMVFASKTPCFAS